VLGRLLEQASAGAKSANPQAAMTYSRHEGSPEEAVRLLPLSELSGSGQNPSRAPSALAPPIFDS
jgi:hypothetical protein